jgi:4-amino-4-deoxy-L-arabinose transferase-like glycosyltransferase
LVDRQRWLIPLTIVIVALALRLGAAYWWQERMGSAQRFAFGDSESYWVLARTIAQGQPYEYGAGMRIFRMPGYPIALAALFALAGDDPPAMWARGLGAVLGTTAVLCVMVLARQLFDRSTALVAGALAAVYPGAISMSVFILSEVLFGPVMVLQLVCWIAAGRTTSKSTQHGLACLAGFLSGCATLARPSWLLFAPFALVWLSASDRPRRRQLAVGFTALAVMMLTLAPWWIRNYRLTGHLVPTTLQVGASLYDGWNPRATGASDMDFVPAFIAEQQQCDARAQGIVHSTFEYRLDQRLRRAALTWASNHPVRVIELMGIKFWRMWSPWPNAADMQGWVFRLAVLCGYTPLAALGAWCLVRNWRRGWAYQLCLLPALYFTFLHVIFVSSIRYREPAMLPWIVLAAGSLTSGWHVVQRTVRVRDA